MPTLLLPREVPVTSVTGAFHIQSADPVELVGEIQEEGIVKVREAAPPHNEYRGRYRLNDFMVQSAGKAT